MKRMLLAVTFLSLLAAGRPLAAQGFTVVVHSSNPVAALSREQVSRIFLKKVARWDNGNVVAPVDFLEGSRLRETFTRAVHGKSVQAVRSYWQQQIFSGRDVPPPEKGSDSEVLKFVRSNPNAIGYVSATAELGRGIKAITVH